jgi:hypothetical protein
MAGSVRRRQLGAILNVIPSLQTRSIVTQQEFAQQPPGSAPTTKADIQMTKAVVDIATRTTLSLSVGTDTRV